MNNIKLPYAQALNLYSLCLTFKQRNYILYRDYLFGNDDPNIIIYIKLTPYYFNYFPEEAMAFNTRTLGLNTKEIDIDNPKYVYPHDIHINMEYDTSTRLTYMCNEYIKKINDLDYKFANTYMHNVTRDLEPIIYGKKADGAIKLFIDNHLIYLPTNITPVKKEKCTIYANIIDNPDNTFTMKFTISFEKLNIYAFQYMAFLKL